MTEFYNRYRRLFTEANPTQKNQNLFTDLRQNRKSPIFHPFNHMNETPRNESIFKKPQKLGRSPALDEFERYILPRLKTEPYQSDKKGLASMSPPYLSHNSYLPSISFESRPRNLTDLRDLEVRNPIISPSNLKKDSNLINNSNKKIVPESIARSKVDLNAIKRQIFYPRKAKAVPQEQINNSKEQKNIELKDSPSSKQRYDQSKADSNRPRNLYESQLYGINQNPYAFANSKLSDIKQIHRFYPKGIINQYKVCLLRRHQKKADLSQRRQRLRQLLEKDEINMISEIR